jgi:hypothetical protein
MGLCNSKKAVKTLNVTLSVDPTKQHIQRDGGDFANLTGALPPASEKASRFEKVKIHANQKKDPEAVVDEDV